MTLQFTLTVEMFDKNTEKLRNLSPKYPIRRQANSDRPAETDLEKLLAKTKQIESIDDNIY
jgi:hypothetical protein